MNRDLPALLVSAARVCSFVLLTIAATASLSPAQWRHNPRVDDDLNGNPSAEVVRFEVQGRAFVLQAENDAARIHWTTPGGYHRTEPPASWTDGSGQSITAVLAGCRVEERDFFLAYTVPVAGFQQELRVARLQWNPNGTVTTVAGWVQVGGSPRNLSMVLRETTSGIDGVLLVWQDTGVSSTVRMQGLSQSGATLSPIWVSPLPVTTASDDAYPPSIASTGDGLGVATYMFTGGYHEVWATKFDAGGAAIFAMPVPGQVQNVDFAWPHYRAVSDGAGGAFFAYSTLRDPGNDNSTDLVHARIAVTWNGSSWVVTPSAVVWQTQPDGLDGARLRPLAMLAMPGSAAMVVYRDDTVIRAYKFDAASGLSAQWVIFVRGADLDNTDEVDAVPSPEGPVLVVTANDDVMCKKLDAMTGQPIWDHGAPRYSEIPINGVFGQAGNAPRRPRVFPTGGPDTHGFLFSWYDDQVSGRPDPSGWYAERIRDDGKLGKKMQLPHSGMGGLIDSTVFLDQHSSSYIELDSILVDLGDGVGTTGDLEIWTRVGQTHQGHENAGDWVLAGSANVVVTAALWIDVEMIPPIALPPGTNGIAIRGVGLSLRTVAGTGADTFGGDPDDVTVVAGSMVSGWPGGTAQPARVFSGGLGYTLLDGPGVATATSQGTGCGSQGPLLLAAGTRPVLGTTVDLVTTNMALPQSIGFVVLGFTPVPGVPLDFLGMNGCSLYQTLDLTFFLATANGAMVLPLVLPADPFLLGGTVYAQSAVRDPIANPFGLAASNGVTLHLGNL
ncbi:MAG: hypothetical protein AB7O97_14245 [Planctomycetota bacterium]